MAANPKNKLLYSATLPIDGAAYDAAQRIVNLEDGVVPYVR